MTILCIFGTDVLGGYTDLRNNVSDKFAFMATYREVYKMGNSDNNTIAVTKKLS